MGYRIFLCLVLVAVCAVPSGLVQAADVGPGPAGSESVQTAGPGAEDDLMAELGSDYGEPGQQAIADPLEPWNRLMFQVNDKLYFWVLHPTAEGYAAVMPRPWRESFANAFDNAASPVRIVNDLLQGDVVQAGQELGACFINTVFGLGGLLEPSRGIPALTPDPPDTDTGLTLGSWGIGHGIYLFWPVIGPSSLRDTVGKVGDGFLHPVYYFTPWEWDIGLKAGDGVNILSLNLDQYQDLKDGALDPYTAFKDGYIQYRKKALHKE